MAQKRTYTIDQIAIAARELREAAGARDEQFTGAQVVEMLEDEIRILRERGFSDERISGLFTGFDIEVKTSQIERRSQSPRNILRRFVWDRIHAREMNVDFPPGPRTSRSIGRVGGI